VFDRKQAREGYLPVDATNITVNYRRYASENVDGYLRARPEESHSDEGHHPAEGHLVTIIQLGMECRGLVLTTGSGSSTPSSWSIPLVSAELLFFNAACSTCSRVSFWLSFSLMAVLGWRFLSPANLEI